MSSGQIKHEDTFIKTTPIWFGLFAISFIIVLSFIVCYFYFLGSISYELNSKESAILTHHKKQLMAYEEKELHSLELRNNGRKLQIPIDYAIDLVVEQYSN